MLSKSILLSLVGFLISFYGGYHEDLVFLILGLLMVFLQISIAISSLEEDVNLLKDRINVYFELQKLWVAVRSMKR